VRLTRLRDRDERARLGITLTEAEELIGDARGEHHEVSLDETGREAGGLSRDALRPGGHANRAWGSERLDGHRVTRRFYGNRKMFSTPLVLWLFALPSGIATLPSMTIGVFQWPDPVARRVIWNPVSG